MAEVVSDFLDLICREMCFIINDRVVRHLDSSLNTSMSLEIKVEIKANGMVKTQNKSTRGTYTAVIPLSTTVPGVVLPFLSASFLSVANGLVPG